MEEENKLKILFNLHGILGSINPGIAIAEKLYSRGHRIIFVVNEPLKNKFICYGFEEILIKNAKVVPLNESFYELLFNLYNKRKFYDPMATPFEKMILNEDNFSMMRFKLAKERSQSLKEIIDSVKPNIIITDIIYLPTIPSIIKSECPWVSLIMSNPLTDTHDERLPPPNSGLSSTDKTQWSMFRNERMNILKPHINLFNKWMTEEGLSPLPENHIHLESPFLNIYNFPEELDYCDLRPLPSNWKRFDAFVRTENEEFIIPEYLNKKSEKLIYFTMGTLLSINVEMMERLIRIMSKLSYRFIVSKGPFAHRYELPDNMYGENTLPQTKVLPLIDMIIFHGGNNTLVEAFYYGKPMIVMPLCTDGYDNAQRLKENGFSIILNPLTCAGDELINAIEKTLNDKQLINRMKEISQRIQRETKSDKLAHAIEDIVMPNKN